MTARIAAASASVALSAVLAGCVSFYEIAVETPIQARIDVGAFQRVLVYGFVSGTTTDIDPNTETVRLLRSQLRNKSELRVIDSDVISLAREVERELGLTPADPPTPDAPAEPTAEPKIETEQDLQRYEQIFANADYWKRIGEEYQSPLIITGSVMFTEIQRSGQRPRVRERTDSLGRVTYDEVQTFENLRGFALVPKFIFIDGRTGAQLHSETFREETLYSATNNTPALSSYFELMDRLLPGFLNTLSTQKIRGTRVLLK